MTRLSAHIGYLWSDLPLRDRLAAAAAAGFAAVEHPEPWEVPAPEMAARLADLGLSFAQVTSGMGGAGEKGLAALPGREVAFRDGFARALDYAARIGCPFVHPMAGVGGAAAAYRGNLEWALEACQGTGLRLLVEAITLPGYFLATLDQACALQDALAPLPDCAAPHHAAPHHAAPHHAAPRPLALLFDSYHAAVLGHDPALWIAAHARRIGHVHIADHPGRHEPGTGRLDFAAVLNALCDSGYAGAIGFEYIPTDATAAGLGFLPGWAARLCAKAPR